MKLIFTFLTVQKGLNFPAEGNHVHVVSVLMIVQFSPFHVLIPLFIVVLAKVHVYEMIVSFFSGNSL
jgi:hypothetical protein